MAEIIGRYYGFIAGLIYHPQSQTYLLLRRAAHRDVGAGAWESVTGRLNQGEGFPAALKREVLEELQIDVDIDFIIGTGHFYRGEQLPENEMIGVLYCCSVESKEAVALSPEHTEMQWVSAEQCRDILPEGHWLLRAIRRAELLRTHLPAVLIKQNQSSTLEM